jgi:hypothetical protein
MSVFYLAALFNTCLVIFIALVLPESLSHEARHALGQAVSAKKNALAEREAAERAWEEESDAEVDEPDVNASGWSRISGVTAKSSRSKRRFHGRMKRLRRRMFAFLSPLRLFIPKTKVVEEGGRVLVRKDYNLLLLVMTMALITSVMVSRVGCPFVSGSSITDALKPGTGSSTGQGTIPDLPLRVELGRGEPRPAIFLNKTLLTCSRHE